MALPARPAYPVNAMAVRHVEGLFTVNEHVVVTIDADELGPVAVVLVGATNVGRITLPFAGLVTNAGGPPSPCGPFGPCPSVAATSCRRVQPGLDRGAPRRRSHPHPGPVREETSSVWARRSGAPRRLRAGRCRRG